MYLKSLDNSISDTKQPSHVDIITWVDQAYKMLKNCKVSSILNTLHIVAQSFTSLMADLRQDINIKSSFSRCHFAKNAHL